MRLIDLFEFVRLKNWENSKDIRLYKKYIVNHENDSIECTVAIVYTDEEGVRTCYNTAYFPSQPTLAENFDMKAMYVKMEKDDKTLLFNKIQFTEHYDNFVIFEPLEEIPFDPTAKSADLIEVDPIDAKIFEQEDKTDTLYIFEFKNASPSELLNIILLT